MDAACPSFRPASVGTLRSMTSATMLLAAAPTTAEISRAHAIASRARCDWRTALRAMREGADAIRTRVVREAIEAALQEVP